MLSTFLLIQEWNDISPNYIPSTTNTFVDTPYDESNINLTGSALRLFKSKLMSMDKRMRYMYASQMGDIMGSQSLTAAFISGEKFDPAGKRALRPADVTAADLEERAKRTAKKLDIVRAKIEEQKQPFHILYICLRERVGYVFG